MDAGNFRHSEHSVAHGRICAAYAKLCGVLWKDEPMKVLYTCALRWVKFHESEIFVKDIAEARSRWANSCFYFSEALVDYQDVLPDDGLANPAVPLLLERALTARLHPKTGLYGAARSTELIPNMSIYSPPLLLFFYSLLPWSILDRSGVTAEPVFWSDVARGVMTVVKDTVSVISLLAVEAWSQLYGLMRQLLKPKS